MESKRAIMAAAVFSILKGAREAGAICDSEVMGGRLRTLIPQPDRLAYSALWKRFENQALTYYYVNLSTLETGIHKDTTDFPEVILPVGAD
jgi:hypothetical protein